jgi:hypothetical protein
MFSPLFRVHALRPLLPISSYQSPGFAKIWQAYDLGGVDRGGGLGRGLGVGRGAAATLITPVMPIEQCAEQK